MKQYYGLYIHWRYFGTSNLMLMVRKVIVFVLRFGAARFINGIGMRSVDSGDRKPGC